MSLTFYRKYRPQTFADVVGQKHVVQTLTNAVRFDRLGHAYLLTGPRGTGKTTLARLFAKAINCLDRKQSESEPCGQCDHCRLMEHNRSLDIIEIDAASHTGVDNIRALRETLSLPPTLGSHKIYIIDEAHMLSAGAWGALLKTLEEPPTHVIFILATTAFHKVPETILSRCQRFDLSRHSLKLIVEKLEKIATQETLAIEKSALEAIALAAEGGMRDAESLLTQIATLESRPITEAHVSEMLGTTQRESIASLLRLLSQAELYPSLKFVRQLGEDGVDLSIFCGSLLYFLRDLLLVRTNPQQGLVILAHLTEEQKTTLGALAAAFTPAQIVSLLELFQVAYTTSKTFVISELPLEIAIVKFLANHDSHSSPDFPVATSERSGADLSVTQIAKTQPQASRAPQPPRVVKKARPTKPSVLKSAATASAPPETGPTETPKHTDAETALSSSLIDLTIVRKQWGAILSAAKTLNASLTLALSTARPLRASASTLVIAVKYPFHKERLETRANQLTLTQAFDSILGSKIKISIVTEEAQQPKIHTTEAASQPDASPSPLVTQAMHLLGGKLVKKF